MKMWIGILFNPVSKRPGNKAEIPVSLMMGWMIRKLVFCPNNNTKRRRLQVFLIFSAKLKRVF
ncbi:MAG: hypothetical protein A2Z57_02965 [Planctomycetes bacterium RIFCSPHIGHO2_12_39_6]|nr:MAG: hypothetical protein A2Z57_02965 [Planctomycetes bacterium RIFCSPHIGHO2_12_39_6]